MKLGMFLHLYQPANQRKNIVEAVTNQCYLPLTKILLKSKPSTKITINVNGSLLEILDKYNQHEVLNNLSALAKNKKVEFTGSAKYHALLPFLNENQIKRQINENIKTLKKYLSDDLELKGFFPPEMAIDQKSIENIHKLGFKWILVDEIAHKGSIETVDNSKLYFESSTKAIVFFRNRRLSNLIMSGISRDINTISNSLKNEDFSDYLIAAMDGETFGHHRPGLMELFEDLILNGPYEFKSLSEISQENYEYEAIQIVPSTWASSPKDIENNIQFLSWSDPKNDIHKLQKQLSEFVCKKVEEYGSNEETLKLLDIALASDHYWWASAKPWWSIEMIEEGAYLFLQVLDSVKNITNEDLKYARNLYQQIVYTAFDWQRSDKIRNMREIYGQNQRIAFKDSTSHEPWIYNAFIDMMKDLQMKAANNQEYEKAILWRDAIYRIENKLDVFEAINAIDLLRTEIPHEEVEKMLDKYTEKFKKMRSGQPEQRD